MHQIERDDIGRLGDPIGIAHGLGQILDQPGPFTQQIDHLGLLVRDLLIAAMTHMPQPQAFAGDIVKLAQQLPLPAVPRAGTDRADIDRSEDGEMAQPFVALHVTDEILDRLGIGQVAFLRGVAHQQMVAHQPRDHLGFAFGEAEARA